MQVGVNYPWFDYGWDFGLGPDEWRGRRLTPRWYDYIDADLEHLHSLGITIIRWFVLADGLSYGTAGEAPYLDAGSHVWRFDPPPLGDVALAHFDELLRRIAAFNGLQARPIQLLPVLIDFHFCEAGVPILGSSAVDPTRTAPNPDWVKQGRADCIVDPMKQRIFLDTVLEPFLSVSRQYAAAIYAWEVMNEPDWITNGSHLLRQNDHPVSATAMTTFLADAVTRIQQSGFKATIGFGLLQTLLQWRIYGDLNQFHHYPGGTRILPPQAFDASAPAIVGEFATATNDIWPELGLDRQSVLDRLRRAQRQRYPVAIPWSFRATDAHTAWSSSVEQDVIEFTEGA